VEAEVDLISRILALLEASEDRPRIFESESQNKDRRFEKLM